MLREELDRLLQQISRRDNQTGPTPSSQELTQRISMLQQSLESATVVPPPGPTEDRVRFGATVTALERGVEVRYRIVGVDEVDFDRGWVSWLSPIAKSLLNARVGDRVRLRTPAGEETLEIRTIDYE
jgi:transcription elongation factor GreB